MARLAKVCFHKASLKELSVRFKGIKPAREGIKYDDFVQYGSEAACRAAGRLATEGKDYIVADGDIMHFLFNV